MQKFQDKESFGSQPGERPTEVVRKSRNRSIAGNSGQNDAVKAALATDSSE